MQTMEKEKIRQAVRESYGKIAKVGTISPNMSSVTTCCRTSDATDATSQPVSCCGAGDPKSEQMAALMGYLKEDMDGIPEGANMGLGCGNPVALASLKSGETVVDLGSGGGFDCFLAAKQVGETGRIIGVDMTPEMVSKARMNAEKLKMKMSSSDWERLSICRWPTTVPILSCPIV
jgi:arsenite methyltransferase